MGTRRTCPHCGASQLDAWATVCPSCGRDLPPPGPATFPLLMLGALLFALLVVLVVLVIAYGWLQRTLFAG